MVFQRSPVSAFASATYVSESRQKDSFSGRLTFVMEFICIDVETANDDPGSICQIGVVSFCDGHAVEFWQSQVQPETVFLPANSRLHGINAQTVISAPLWPKIHEELENRIVGRIVASHTYFDQTAIHSASQRYGLKTFEVRCWVDTCALARECWPHLRSYKLAHLARCFHIRFQAHDALEDARCAGEVLLHCARVHGMSCKALLDQQEAAWKYRKDFFARGY